MKSFKFLRVLLLLLITFMVYGYKPLPIDEKKTESLIGDLDGITALSFTNKIFVIYSVGLSETERAAARLCLAGNLSGLIMNTTNCTNDENAETVTFGNILFPPTSIIDEVDDDEELPVPQHIRIISSQELMNAISMCNGIMGASTAFNCSGSGGLIVAPGF